VHHRAANGKRDRRRAVVTASARHAAAAALAAFVASAGDLLLLYVGNAQRPELALPPAGPAWLWLGGALGVLAIPFYALGYRAAARLVAPASVRGARALFATGAAGALVGSVIHGLTTWHIQRGLASGAAAGDPMASLAESGSVLLVAWGIAALLVLVASAVFLWFVTRDATDVPRAAGLANPALLTLVLAAAGLPSDLLRSFLTPAAPNIAHLVFFIVCARVLRATRA